MKNQISEVELTYKRNIEATKKVTSSQSVYEVFKSVYDFNKIDHKEFFYAMYLSRSNIILGVLLIGEGGLSGCMADPKLIFQGALKLNASSIILSHNHPSGNVQPSQADKDLTNKIKEGAKYLDFQILDHIIVSSESYYSFADSGNL